MSKLVIGGNVNDYVGGYKDAVHAAVIVCQVAESEYLTSGDDVLINVKHGIYTVERCYNRDQRHGIIDPFSQKKNHEPWTKVLVLVDPRWVHSEVRHDFDLKFDNVNDYVGGYDECAACS